MPRDYAKRKTSKKNISTSYWLTTGILIGVFIAGLFYLKTHVNRVEPEKISKTSSNKTQRVSENKNSKPRFDFYTMLPKMRVETLNSSRQPVKNNPPLTLSKLHQEEQFIADEIKEESHLPMATAKIQTFPANNYFLHVADLNNFERADKLNAELSLLGFPIIVSKSVVNGKNLHHLYVGPFKNVVLAEEAKHNLARYNIKSVLCKTVG